MTEPKNFIVVGGSSGIGFELTRRLIDDGHQVTALSRSIGQLIELTGIRHVPFDVTRDQFPSDGLPDKLCGLAYCPGTIRLRPFARLTEDEFLEDYRINLLGAVAVIKGCLNSLEKGRPHGSDCVVQHCGRRDRHAVSCIHCECKRGRGGADTLSGRRVCAAYSGQCHCSLVDRYAAGQSAAG